MYMYMSGNLRESVCVCMRMFVHVSYVVIDIKMRWDVTNFVSPFLFTNLLEYS